MIVDLNLAKVWNLRKVVTYGDASSKNMLIYGDKLLALKELKQDFAGKIKCICIDPLYNTGAAFAHHDDGLDWLNAGQYEHAAKMLVEIGRLLGGWQPLGG